MRRNLRLAAAIVAALAFAGPADAAPTWLDPTQLSEPRRYTTNEDVNLILAGHGSPTVAMSPAGEAIVVWSRRDPADVFRLYASIRAPGGAWSLPQEIGIARSSGILAMYEYPPPAALAIDARGNAIVVFDHPVGGESVMQAAFRPAGGSFGQPVMLSAPGQSAREPSVAMNADGDAVAAWIRSDGTHTIVQAAVRPAGGGFGATVNLSAPGQDGDVPHVAISDNGTVAATWVRGITVQASVRPPRGAFTSPQDLGEGGPFNVHPTVALDPAGRATVAWVRTSNWTIMTMQRDTTGPFTGFQEISPPGQSSFQPALVVDEHNTAIAAWHTETPEGVTMFTASRSNGALFGAPEPMSPPNPTRARQPVSLSIDPSGGVLAVWPELHETFSLRAARRPAGGRFGAVTTINTAPRSATAPRVATDAAGNGVVAYYVTWVDPSPPTWTMIAAAGFDFAPPELRDVTVPADAATGVPVTFSAAASDVWSDVASVRWSFGDGATATGTPAFHTYTTPGTYTVAVTATDAVGNAATATRRVTVHAPPAAPPAPAAPAPPPVPPVTPAATGVDRDGDGFFAGQDCNDTDRAIHPGARETRGNRVDENCDGVAEPRPTVTSGVITRWHVRGTHFRLTALRITQSFPNRWRVRILCKGRRCPFKAKTLRRGKVRNNASNVIGSLRQRQRRFRAGQTLEVWVSAPGHNTKVARYRLRRGRIPSAQPLCALPGTRLPQRSCD